MTFTLINRHKYIWKFHEMMYKVFDTWSIPEHSKNTSIFPISSYLESSTPLIVTTKITLRTLCPVEIE